VDVRAAGIELEALFVERMAGLAYLRTGRENGVDSSSYDVVSRGDGMAWHGDGVAWHGDAVARRGHEVAQTADALAARSGRIPARGMLAGMNTCLRCTRRTALVGIGALALGAALPGCAAKSSLSMGSASSCSGGLCLDLTVAANAPLRTVGGAVLVSSARDSIAVVRTSDTQIAALSAICTHEGCLNEYDASGHSLDCPCHGSSFSLTGAVLAGPARLPLRTYSATLSADTITIVGA
jgi:cytochrome b6-f complex iron-sulfur subunit